MEEQISNIILIPIVLLVLDLIISGIIGLKNKQIYPEGLLARIVFFPLGILGKIITNFLEHAETEPKQGKTAIVASISALAVAVLIMLFFGFYYADEHGLRSPELAGTVVPIVLVVIIILVPLAVVMSVKAYERKEKSKK